MFCPRCRAEYREGFTECYDCKVSLVPELTPESQPEHVDFVTVFATRDPAMLATARSALEAAAIEYFVKGELALLSYGYLPALGPVEIQVAEDKQEEARALLEGIDRLEEGDSLEVLAEQAHDPEPPPADLARISTLDILHRAFRTYRQEFLRILAILLGPFLLLFPLEVWLDRTFGVSARWEVRISPLQMPQVTGLVFILDSLYAVGGAALILFLAQRHLGGKPGIWSAYRPVRRRIFTLIWVDIALSILWSVPYFFVFSLNLHRFLPQGPSWVSDLYYFGISILSKVCGVVVGLYRLSLAPIGIIVENRPGWDAMRRSWALMRHNSWRAFILSVSGNCAEWVVTSIIWILVLILGTWNPDLAGGIGATISGHLGHLIASPFALISYLLLYFEIRNRSREEASPPVSP